MNKIIKALLCVAATAVSMFAAPVIWVDWTSGTAGTNGSATGVLDIGGTIVDVTYTGEVAFLQTGVGTNYYSPSGPYISPAVDNAPPAAEMIALSQATSKTLTFSKPIDNLFFAVVSLNGNGYQFDSDFEIVSTGCGYWGCGGLTKVAVPGGFQMNSTGGEPHGVVRFTSAISSITWTSLTNEYWNGFTVGTYGLAPDPSAVPEPSTGILIASALGAAMFSFRRYRRQ
jgi:hypothetical protein